MGEDALHSKNKIATYFKKDYRNGAAITIKLFLINSS